MIGVQHEQHIERVCLCRRIAVILSEQVEDVLRDGQLLLRIVDRQRLPVIVMLLDLKQRSDQRRHARQQFDPLPQGILRGGVLRILIIVKQREHHLLQPVHQMRRMGREDVDFHEAVRQLVCAGQQLVEPLQLLCAGQPAEQQQEAGFLKAHMRFIFHQ